MSTVPCRVCRTPRPRRMYLCRDCWFELPELARRALNRRDSRAFARLRELHKQIDAGVPLTGIRISP